MKRYVILTTLLTIIALLAIACNPPRDRRTTRSEQFMVDNSGNQNNNSDSDSTTPAPVDPVVNPTDPEVATVPGMSHCQFAFSNPDNSPTCVGATNCNTNQYLYTHSHIGSGNGYNICQNSEDSKKVHLQILSPLNDAKLCIIPTSNRNGLTVFIGEPRCLMMSEAHKVYDIPLLTNRVGFESLPINGIMLIRDKTYFFGWPFNQYLLAPDAFIFCSQWLDNYNDPSYCNTFNAVGEYIYHQFN